MKPKNILWVLLLLYSVHLSSQTQNENNNKIDIFSSLAEPGAGLGKVSIFQEDAIKLIVNRYIEYRRKDGKLTGYRIRIYSDSGTSARQKALTERSRFVDEFSEIPAYLEYEAPNFKIYVGDFRSKLEGFKFYKKISKEFRNAFLVPTRINLPKL